MNGIFMLLKYYDELNFIIMKTQQCGYWNVKKEKLRKRYPYLTEADLRFNLGKEREMIEMLGYKMGLSKQALLKIIVSI